LARYSFISRHFRYIAADWQILMSLRVEIPSRTSYNENMLHLIWYLFVGFVVGCVAKALMHMHLSITWTVVLGIVGSIIGGAVTHLFYPPSAGGKFHLGGLIVSIIGAILVLYIWHKFRLQLPRKLTWTGSTLAWDCARSRFQNCEKRPLCLYR